jgi:hypothetical protein
MNNKEVGIIIYAITLALTVLLTIYASYENYFNNSSNGKVTMRDEGVKDENGFANRIRRGACKVKSYVINAIRFIQKKAKVALQKIGIIPRSYSSIDYKKRKC